MKLNKFLIGLAPIAIVGTIVPTVSCSKSNSFNFEYGDDINCLEHRTGKGAIPFHSIGDVGNAVKWHVDVEHAREMSPTDATKILEHNYQNAYFDLIASCTLIEHKGFIISNWDITTKFSFDIQIEPEQTPQSISGEAKYIENDDGKFSLQIGQSFSVPSYTLKDVTPI